MDKRPAQVLYGLIEQYIQTARPVSSSFLEKKLDLSLSSASIRLILNDLDDAGFIYQPHTSAGRVPTDQGYRFYLNTLHQRRLSALQHQRVAKQWQALVDDSDQLAGPSADLLSSLSNAVAICAWEHQANIGQAGLAPLIQHLADYDHQLDTVQEIAEVLQRLDDLLDLIDNQDESTEPTVFIGQENPLISAQHTSLIARKFRNHNHEAITLIVTGPKRMPYQRNRAYINSLAEILSQ